MLFVYQATHLDHLKEIYINTYRSWLFPGATHKVCVRGVCSVCGVCGVCGACVRASCMYACYVHACLRAACERACRGLTNHLSKKVKVIP